MKTPQWTILLENAHGENAHGKNVVLRGYTLVQELVVIRARMGLETPQCS